MSSKVRNYGKGQLSILTENSQFMSQNEAFKMVFEDYWFLHIAKVENIQILEKTGEKIGRKLRMSSLLKWKLKTGVTLAIKSGHRRLSFSELFQWPLSSFHII